MSFDPLPDADHAAVGSHVIFFVGSDTGDLRLVFFFDDVSGYDQGSLHQHRKKSVSI